VSSGKLAVRAYLYTPVALLDGTSLLWLTSANYQQGAILQVKSGDWTILPVGPAFTAAPVGRWFCVEVVLDVGHAGRVQLFVDSAPVVDTAADTLAATYSRLQLGFTS